MSPARSCCGPSGDKRVLGGGSQRAHGRRLAPIGDIGVMDENGYFRIVDRIKDMVNVSGMKVSTTKVNEMLFRHPSVAVAASFGAPNPAIPGSERVMAVVKLKEAQRQTVTEQEIKEFCAANLPPYTVQARPASLVDAWESPGR